MNDMGVLISGKEGQADAFINGPTQMKVEQKSMTEVKQANEFKANLNEKVIPKKVEQKTQINETPKIEQSSKIQLDVTKNVTKTEETKQTTVEIKKVVPEIKKEEVKKNRPRN